MRYLLCITLKGGETLNAWASTRSAGEGLGYLLCTADEVESIELHDAKVLPSTVLRKWEPK